MLFGISFGSWHVCAGGRVGIRSVQVLECLNAVGSCPCYLVACRMDAVRFVLFCELPGLSLVWFWCDCCGLLVRRVRIAMFVLRGLGRCGHLEGGLGVVVVLIIFVYFWGWFRLGCHWFGWWCWGGVLGLCIVGWQLGDCVLGAAVGVGELCAVVCWGIFVFELGLVCVGVARFSSSVDA